jgi:hypothetical protein
MSLREEARQAFPHELRYFEEKQPGTGRRFREAVNASFG